MSIYKTLILLFPLSLLLTIIYQLREKLWKPCLLLLIIICGALLMGYPVAFTLAGISILFALICIPFGIFDPTIFKSIPIRILES